MEITDYNPLAPLSTPSPGELYPIPIVHEPGIWKLRATNHWRFKYPLLRGIIPDTHRKRGWNMEITKDNPLAPLSTPSPGELYAIPFIHEARICKLRTTIHWRP